MALSSDLKKFALVSLIIAVPAIAVFYALNSYSSEDAVGMYADVVGIMTLGVGTLLLLLVIPKVRDRFFRTTTVLIATGVAFQFIFSLIWFYYWHIADWGRMPNVGIGDFFYLGSYVLWAGATLPFLRRYGNLMSLRSTLILCIYAVIAAVIVFFSADYWYNAALSYGYDWAATYVWLSYAVVPAILAVLPLAITLLYGLEGYGRGLLRFYWLYFLVPILMIVAADLLNGFYYVLSEGSLPNQLDDVLYLAAYCVMVSSGYVVYSARLAEVDATPVIEAHHLKGRKIDVVRGRGHIVEDPEGALAYNLMVELVTGKEGAAPKKGYIVSRQNPAQMMQEYGLKDSRVTWISTAAGENVLDPSKPGLIAQEIMDFFQRNREGVVLFDGVESIMVHNDFSKAIRMLEQINDFVMQYQGYLLVPLDPKAFETRELALLQRDFERISAHAS